MPMKHEDHDTKRYQPEQPKLPQPITKQSGNAQPLPRPHELPPAAQQRPSQAVDKQQQPNAQQQKKKATPRKKLPRWARITLTVVKIAIVPVLTLIALYAGLTIGYVYLGGQPMDEVWKLDTWKHVYDLVFSAA